MQKTMKWGQRSESNLSIAASPYCFASIWFHHKKYRVLSLSLACAPQRDSTFVNLRDTEGARARRSVLNLSIPRLVPFAKIMQINHLNHLISSKSVQIVNKYTMYIVQLNNLSMNQGTAMFHNHSYHSSWDA